MRRWTRWLVLAVVCAGMLPAVAAMPVAAVANPAAVALRYVPEGYARREMHLAYLGGKSYAAVIVERPRQGSSTGVEQIVVLLRQERLNWVLDYRTPPDTGAGVSVTIHRKTARHPDFVVITWQRCGANCGDGEYVVLRWDATGEMTMPLRGATYRGALATDADTGALLLTAPLYAVRDANCCPRYELRRGWVWQGDVPVEVAFSVAPTVGGADGPAMLPDWLPRDGAGLVVALAPLGQYERDVASLAPLFAPTVTVSDAAEKGCDAPGAAVAGAFAALPRARLSGLWPAADGGYIAAVTFAPASDAPTAVGTAQAGGCTLGGFGAEDGYLATLRPTANGWRVDALRAVPRVYDAVPDTAIIPPGV